MGRWFTDAVNWLTTHLVALGFLGFLIVAVIFRADLFGIFMKQPPRGASAEEKAVAEARLAEIQARAAQAAKKRAESHVFRPLEPGEAETASMGVVAEQALPVPGTLRPATPPATRTPPGSGTPEASYAEVGSARPGVSPGQGSAGTGDTLAQNRAGDTSQLPPEALLAQAREAFRNGRLDEAETLYRNYIRLRPEDPDGFGELGNVYHALKRDKEAKDAYFQAGLRLKFEGDQDRLERLRQWLEHAGDARAKVLAR